MKPVHKVKGQMSPKFNRFLGLL